MEIQVGHGSKVINGVDVAVFDSHGNAITLKLNGREVHLLQGQHVIIENPNLEERQKSGTVFLTLLKVQRGIAIFRHRVQKSVARREIVRKQAKKNRPLRQEAMHSAYDHSFES